MTSRVSRKNYLQMMRIIACILVIYNHTYSFYQFGLTTGIKQMFFMILTMITRINVPLFLMISGALLLEKSEDWAKVFKKRFVRVLGILLIFEFILLLINKYVTQNSDLSIGFGKFFISFLQNDIYGAFPYWYMYSYLGFLFVLPFMQRIAHGITKVEIIALLCLHFLMQTFLPFMNLILLNKQVGGINICADFSVPFAMEKILFFPLIGYYIEHNIDVTKIKARHILGLVLAGSIGIGISIYSTFFNAAIINDYTQDYIDLCNYIIAIVAFIAIK